MSRWHLPAGTAAGDGFDLALDPGKAGLEHCGLYVGSLAPGGTRHLDTGDAEWVVLPLAGSVQVRCGEDVVDLEGRAGPFAGPSDLAYLPVHSRVELQSTGGARIALPHASATQALPCARTAAADVPVELRGAGQSSRQVHNFGTPGVLEAQSLIACEVLTPAGNWSSYPPHKHDEDRPGQESVLEEIYYVELRREGPEGRAGGGGNGGRPLGYLRVYGTADRPIEVLAEVRDGDVVVVPHGWHGPAMAPPGYDMYYLNVMAGPGPERAWRICDDPDHGWVRDTWAGQPVDARLPFGGAR